MSFPWIFESNFETGDNSEWTSETDTVSQLDFPSYKELARSPHRTSAPFSGANCMRLQLTGGTADAFVLQDDINIAAAAQTFIKFDIWFSDDFTGTADDTFAIFEAQGAASAIQAVLGARIVATTNVINLGIGELAATSFSGAELQRGVWHTVELDITIDNAGADDGTIDMYVTKEGDAASTSVAATQVASLDQIAVIQGVLGVQNHLATTTGTILIDNFIQDDARVYPKVDRFSETILLTKSGHAFVGPGTIDNVSLLSGTTTADNVLTVYNTDSADTTDASNIVVELKNTATDEIVDPAGTPVYVQRGAYVSLSGDTPRALVKICKVDAFGSAAAVRRAAGVHL